MNAFATKVGIQLPIVQGPFGGGLSSVTLAAAVSNAGGLGSYGAHHLAPEEIRELVRELRAETRSPFNINLWVSRYDPGAEVMTQEHHAAGLRQFAAIYERLGIEAPPLEPAEAFTFEQQVEAVLEARPAVFSFVFGIPEQDVLRECGRRGMVTMGAATTVDEAVALDEAGVDVIVATGSDAGGHRPSFLRAAEDSLTGTMSVVPQVRRLTKRPLVAAGGIADASGVRAALALGADAAQIGTAFLACEESGCSVLHREALFSPAALRTKLSRHFTGRLARFIATPMLEELESCGHAALPFPMQSWFAGPLKVEAKRTGNPSLMPLYSGQAAGLLMHRRAEDLMKELLAEL